MDPCPRCWYFGCWDRAGHYLWSPRGEQCSKHHLGSWTSFDGLYAPRGWYKDKLGFWKRTVRDGWTVIACWDCSVDERYNSNAAFIVEGEHSVAEALEVAKAKFPGITARILRQFSDECSEAKD